MPHVTYAPAGKRICPACGEIFCGVLGGGRPGDGACFFPVRGRPVVRQNGRLPAAILAAMPVTLALPQGEYKARYFYGWPPTRRPADRDCVKICWRPAAGG